nr:ATP-binding cassette domain-containing protein [Micromonospora sp. DSM 115978]
ATLRDNLSLARPGATDTELLDALARVRLDRWLATLPAGLASRVGTDGAAMSGGQRQRLLLARLLLAEAPVMVFDEPTAHLDPPTAAALLDVLFEATQGRTVVLVSHRGTEHDPRFDAVVEVRDGSLRTLVSVRAAVAA